MNIYMPDSDRIVLINHKLFLQVDSGDHITLNVGDVIQLLDKSKTNVLDEFVCNSSGFYEVNFYDDIMKVTINND